MADGFDWIVIGAGIAGSALGYELSRQGCSVLLIEKDSPLQDATRYSYGGLAHWAGRTPLMKSLGAAGIERYRQLEAELGQSIQFRELDLLMPIPETADPQQVAQDYQAVRIPPQLLSPAEAVALEPLLDGSRLSGALVARHGHIRPELAAAAFADGLVQRGGQLLINTVSQVRPGSVQAGARTYHADQIAICAGAWGRSLLQAQGIRVPLYFTHAELVEVDPSQTAGIWMQTMITPALLQRFELEKSATQPDRDPLWNHPDQEVLPSILDSGVIQMRDGSLRMGQISRVSASLDPIANPTQSEAQIRAGIGQWIPAVRDVAGMWRHCRVAFCPDQLPLVGTVPGLKGQVHLFAGFSNPLAVVPVVAERFARAVTSGSGTIHQDTIHQDQILAQLAPSRFAPAISNGKTSIKTV